MYFNGPVIELREILFFPNFYLRVGENKEKRGLSTLSLGWCLKGLENKEREEYEGKSVAV